MADNNDSAFKVARKAPVAPLCAPSSSGQIEQQAGRVDLPAGRMASPPSELRAGLEQPRNECNCSCFAQPPAATATRPSG